MKEETFEQKRIVQLSRQLDAQRQKYTRLTKECNQLNTRLKQANAEIEQHKQHLIEYQINHHQLQEKTREMQRDMLKAHNELEYEKKARSTAEVQNVRQRQIIDELKQDMAQFENKSKTVLYERTAQIADKDKEIYRLKQENLEVQKLYLNERERLQRKSQKSLRDLSALYKEFQALRRQLMAFKNSTNSVLEAQQKKHKQQINEVQQKIRILEAKLRKQQQLQSEIEYLKLRLQEVIIENSQKIIQLYKYKYAG